MHWKHRCSSEGDRTTFIVLTPPVTTARRLSDPIHTGSENACTYEILTEIRHTQADRSAACVMSVIMLCVLDTHENSGKRLWRCISYMLPIAAGQSIGKQTF